MRKIALISVLVLIAIAVIPASAARALDVIIEVHPATIDPEVVEDSFTASGPAVDDGLMCADGISSNERVLIKGPENPRIRLLRVIKLFVCNDSSGSIRVRLDVELDVATGDTSGDWSILDGTGDYANIEGEGSLVGVPVILGESIDDTYIGRLRVENGQVPTCFDDEFEPNNSYFQASSAGGFAHGEGILLSGSSCGNNDWFKFTVVDSLSCGGSGRDFFTVSVTLIFSHSEGDLALQLWGSNKVFLLGSNGMSDGEEVELAWIGTSGDDSRTLYTKISGVDGAENDYLLLIGPVLESCTF